MHPKFVLISIPEKPLTGRFVYGIVGKHKELITSARERLGYVRDYTFIFSPGWNLPGNELDLSDVEWI